MDMRVTTDGDAFLFLKGKILDERAHPAFIANQVSPISGDDSWRWHESQCEWSRFSVTKALSQYSMNDV